MTRAAGLAWMAIGLATAPAQAAGGIKVEAGAGCAKASPEAACSDVAPGATVGASSTLVAGAGGLTLSLADRSVVRLAEGTEVKLLPRTKLQLGRGDTPAEAMMLTRGKVLADVAPAGGGAVLVKTSQGVAAVVKRGAAAVKVSDDAVALATLRGASVLGSGSEFNEVPEGKMRVVPRGDPKGTMRDLVRAPGEARLGAGVQFRFGGRSEPVKLTWSAPAGAQAHEVEVRPAGKVPVVRRLPAGASELALGELAPGAYEVAVRAIDGEGFEGSWSAVQRLSVVDVELPTGASAQGDLVQLPDRRKLKMKPVDGLEASYDQLTTFIPAPAEVGLTSDRITTLRLRRKGETSETTLRLAPRSLQAQVSMTPRNARWPADTIQIEVRLTSTLGVPPPSDVEMRPHVTLDQEVLSPSWTRDGITMRASVPPRADKKPHVLRVEVTDQHGLGLGRGFVEIAADGAPSR